MTARYDPIYEPLPSGDLLASADPPDANDGGRPSGPPAGRGLSRRRFLVGAGVAGVAGAAAAIGLTRPWEGLVSSPGPAAAGAIGAGKGTLVLVSLYGGNDGLNTVIPYTDPAYHSGRPTLGYTPEQVLPLADGLALNGTLKGFKGLWDVGQLAVVRGVGYANPSLSHFQSMDIWQTANLYGDGPGWLGRWLDATGTDPMRAISIGTTLPPALRGEKSAATAITSTGVKLPGRPSAQGAFVSLAGPGPDRSGLAAQVAQSGSDLLAVQRDLARLSGISTPNLAATGRSTAEAGGTGFAGQLQGVASLIKAGAPSRVYQVSLSSFDTHADEKANHERLLGELDAGVSGFFSALKGSSHGNGVVLMTFSEFGRRVSENASGGTDHGTSAPLFIAGPAVKGGKFYGEEPSLTDLDGNGDLKFNVDFRSVYATVFDRVLGVDPKTFLSGAFPTLAVI